MLMYAKWYTFYKLFFIYSDWLNSGIINFIKRQTNTAFVYCRSVSIPIKPGPTSRWHGQSLSSGFMTSRTPIGIYYILLSTISYYIYPFSTYKDGRLVHVPTISYYYYLSEITVPIVPTCSICILGTTSQRLQCQVFVLRPLILWRLRWGWIKFLKSACSYTWKKDKKG